MDKPWYIDLMTGVVVLLWMGWTYATIQTYGPSPALIGGALVVGVVGMLLIYGQRLTYLQVGSWIVVGMGRGARQQPDEPQHPGRED